MEWWEWLCAYMTGAVLTFLFLLILDDARPPDEWQPQDKDIAAWMMMWPLFLIRWILVNIVWRTICVFGHGLKLLFSK